MVLGYSYLFICWFIYNFVCIELFDVKDTLKHLLMRDFHENLTQIFEINVISILIAFTIVTTAMRIPHKIDYDMRVPFSWKSSRFQQLASIHLFDFAGLPRSHAWRSERWCIVVQLHDPAGKYTNPSGSARVVDKKIMYNKWQQSRENSDS